MNRIQRQHLIVAALACGLGGGWICPLATGAQSDEPTGNEYRLTLSPRHDIWGDLTGFGQFEYRNNPEQDDQAYQVFWPGLAYPVTPWPQLSGGLLTRYTENEQSANTLEVRPYAGVKLFVLNNIKWNFYNYTRYEFRDSEDLDTKEWTSYGRIRSRFGVTFPLTSRQKAWQPKTWYGLADVEPIYHFDRDTVDPLYVRGGLGDVLSDRLRLEFCYWAQFTRSNRGSLEHANNIFQLNVKIAFGKGILGRLFNGGDADG